MNQSMEHSRRRFLSIGDSLEKKAAASVSSDAKGSGVRRERLREENRLEGKSDVFKTGIGSTAVRSLPPSGMQIPPALSGIHSGKYNPSSLL